MSIDGKKSNGQFAKGTSGNPSGRPPGSRNKVSLLVEALLEGEAEQLTRRAIELALAGDIHALRLCIDRLTPPCKDRLVHFELPPARNLNQISLRLDTILGAISEGRITPQEGEVLSRILCAHAHLLTTQDLEQRVEKLERARVPGAPNVQGVQGILSKPGVSSEPSEQGEEGEEGVLDAQGVSGASEQLTSPDPDNVTILRRPSWEVAGGRGTAHGDSSPDPSGGLRFRLESIGKGPRVQGVPSEPSAPGVQGILSESGEQGVSDVLGVPSEQGDQGEEGVSGAQGVSSESGVLGVSDVLGVRDNVTILTRPLLEAAAGRGTSHGDFPQEPGSGAELRLESIGKGPSCAGYFE